MAFSVKTLPDSKKGDIFRMLNHKSTYDTGIEFGFDKHFKDVTGVKNAVYRIYKAVVEDPQRYFVTPEVAQMVQEKMSTRSATVFEQKKLAEQKDELENVDFKSKLLQGRDSAFRILQSKMERVSSSKKRLDEVNLSTLAQTFGILFDKAQIIQGEATENVAVLAKIDKDMPPEDAIQAVLRARENNQADKDRKRK